MNSTNHLHTPRRKRRTKKRVIPRRRRKKRKKKRSLKNRILRITRDDEQHKPFAHTTACLLLCRATDIKHKKVSFHIDILCTSNIKNHHHHQRAPIDRPKFSGGSST